MTDALARCPDLSLPETPFVPLEDPGPGTGTTPALRVTPPQDPPVAATLYLGHKNIQHTVRYTELTPERFRDFWKD
jgi:hypothetical protein